MQATQNNSSAIIIIGILFFVFGFVTWLNGPLITYIKLAFGLDTDSKAFWVTTAFYMAYFFLALPSSWVLEKTGIKKGMAMALKESSYPIIENFDHACRNNTGYLMTLGG